MRNLLTQSLALSLALSACANAPVKRGIASSGRLDTTQALQCAAGLVNMNRFIISFSLQAERQQEYVKFYDVGSDRLFLFAGDTLRTLYILNAAGVYRVDLPFDRPKPAIFVDERLFYVAGLPEGPLYFLRNIIRPESALALYEPTAREIKRLGEPLQAVPASAEDLAEFQAAYREKMGLLFKLLPSIEAPNYASQGVNAMKGIKAPTSEEIRDTREKCEGFFE